MSGRAETFLIEPDGRAFEAEEVKVDDARMRALLVGPDHSLSDYEVALALLEILHAEVTEMAAEDYGFLTRAQVSLAFNALHATAQRAGWTRLVP
jgi:hypothetical protein